MKGKEGENRSGIEISYQSVINREEIGCVSVSSFSVLPRSPDSGGYIVTEAKRPVFIQLPQLRGSVTKEQARCAK